MPQVYIKMYIKANGSHRSSVAASRTVPLLTRRFPYRESARPRPSPRYGMRDVREYQRAQRRRVAGQNDGKKPPSLARTLGVAAVATKFGHEDSHRRRRAPVRNGWGLYT